MEYRELRQGKFTGERALFNSNGLKIYDSVFEDGESPLKESEKIELENCMFRWKYPLWYCSDVRVNNCAFFENSRAGIWYTDNILFDDCVIDSPKNFRRSRNIVIRNTPFSNAAETLWKCEDITLENVSVSRGDYFCMNSAGINVDRLFLFGNYGFDGARDIHIKDSKLLTKDAFWNSKNVTVENSFISGEYLGWNSENLTFINCTIESLQGLCYIKNLVLENCKLINTTLAFEYSSVDAQITTRADSIFNPSSGRIKAKSIGELILEADKIDPSKTIIETEE